MDEGKRRQEISTGAQAEAILRNPVFEETFDYLINHYNTQLLNTLPEQHEERERIYYQIRALRHVREEIENVMQTGYMAEKELGENLH
tara:strand:+ start:111 stop:374 length:264 start_codon:yes stop_codon:yes gene_type:complete